MKKILSVCVLLSAVAGMYFYMMATECRGDWQEVAISDVSSGNRMQKNSLHSTSSKANAEETGDMRQTDTEAESFDWYTCTETADGYELVLYDHSGQEVYGEVFPKEPVIRWITEELMEISISVGSPAVYVFWFDTEKARISDTYFNPILVGERYVAYMEDNEELLLRDLFGEGLLEMRIRRNFTKTADPISAIWQIEMTDSEKIVLTYLEGEDYTEVTETIKLEKPYVLTEEEKRVLLAYAKYLQKYFEEYPYETEGIKYDLVFVDIDNIPELAIIPSDAHASGVTLCVYHDRNVTEVGRFGSFGKCRFHPYENLIFSTYMGQGEEESFFYRIEGTEKVELLALHSVPKYREDKEYIGHYYEVDGVEVSEEVYRQVCEEWNWEELDVWGYDDAVSVNDIDDLYREMCGRLISVKGRERMEQGSGQDDSCLEEWRQAYLDYLAEDEYADTRTYSLIYVDDDEIPELVIDTGFEAGGCEYLTFHDHVLDVWQSARLNVTYIERGNLICNSDGNMGYYYDNVYTIQDGKWVFVDGGTWGDGPDGVQLDENGDYIEFFYWDDKEITEEEYEARLNDIYPTEQGMCPQKYYIADELRSVLRTGDVVSVEHRYELIVEDVTWKEAWEICRERGGYLATITSQEEFERLQDQIITENKEDVTFFVGAARERGGEILHGYRWMEPGNEYNIHYYHNVFLKLWAEEEYHDPDSLESDRKVSGNYVSFFYRESDQRCYLDDVPNDVIKADPSYAGRVGYICEYE